MQKANLFELLGRPVSDTARDEGTLVTDSPETYDDNGQLPSVLDRSTSITRVTGETYDDDGLLPLH
ncbi:hypothetical protein [Candidatus Poriferisodalis sp.]|uniref:hypothetical protein n=1 Tax=Candidatus Poriferisodalis sp. TaxID=3101277 RepID=UPI003B021497